MDKLEEDVFNEFDGLTNDLMAELKVAESEDRSIDLKNFIEKLSARYKSLNTAFRDVKIRQKETKKRGGWF